MGIAKFKTDLEAAAQKAAAGNLPGISSISSSANRSDGEVIITYNHRTLSRDIRIHAVCQDVGNYPDENSFMVFTEDFDPPKPVTDAIQSAQDYLLGISVYEMASELSRSLAKEFRKAANSTSSSDDSEDGNFADISFGEEEEDDDDDFPFDDDDDEIFGLATENPRQFQAPTAVQDIELIRQRMKQDLRQVREAGYKVGFLGCLGQSGIQGTVSISIRVDKLSLSYEAMEAWDVDRDDYLVLLIRFENAYTPLERIVERATRSEVSFLVGKCKKYKPSLAQAISAFTGLKRAADWSSANEYGQPPTKEDGSDRFQKLFISNSLDQYLNESFVSLLKIRNSRGCSWEKANDVLAARVAMSFTDQKLPDIPMDDAMDLDPEPDQDTNHILACDHLTESRAPDRRSFPLVAMQFTIRYFMRCTEYCLRCHRKLDKEFEALRPYVCDDPLCLFQYMAMGFGPSIEHEIVTEPYVVDLLVSLCYAAVQSYHTGYFQSDNKSLAHQLPIRTLPVGLRLQVPDLYQPADSPKLLKARLNLIRGELVFTPAQIQDKVRREGKWIAYRVPGKSLIGHGIITSIATNGTSTILKLDKTADSTSSWGVGYLGRNMDYVAAGNLAAPPRDQPPPASTVSEVPVGTEDLTAVEVFFYDADFDSLSDSNKGDAMRHLLDTLPSVLDMEAFLKAHPHRTVRDMPEVSPAAASLLQWIVSSNRSCIYQIDRCRPLKDVIQQPSAFSTSGQARTAVAASTPPESVPVQTPVDAKAGKGRDREHERIQGMEGWIQFRFAQGSPDKEMRFNRALQEVASQRDIKANPTIFAWHGSALSNWHSIVRTGLDFRDVRSGRAFGNGVYFSHDYGTSIGYTGQGVLKWPNSDLSFGACMSLNEIINAPDQFVSKSPHLVVAQPDWHQCRYLFVQSAVAQNRSQTDAVRNESDKSVFHKQLPRHKILGAASKELQIPLSAIPFRNVTEWGKQSTTAAKRTIRRLESQSSDEEDQEDAKFLYSAGDLDAVEGPQHKRPNSMSPSVGLGSVKDMIPVRPPTPENTDKGLTDFEPGSLDLSTVPRLKPPSFANPLATKALSRELKRMKEIQEKTPLHELGWYMDVDEVDNLFQWIVQLHSFDPFLPLAQDMKVAGITSIVLEIRFGRDYPVSPPFVRVVRPRFLPFMNGGGGHVTAGGAMCMELLTNSGWSAANSMESVLLQVRMALCSPDPRPARLERRAKGFGTSGGSEDYGVSEAIHAYLRAVKTHGWQAPADLMTTAHGV